MSKAAKRGKKKEASNPSLPRLDSASAGAPIQSALNTSGAQSVASNVPSPSPAPSSSRRKSKAVPASAEAPVKPTPKAAAKENPPANSNNFGPIETPIKKKPNPPAPKSAAVPPKPAKGAKVAAPKPSQPASGPSKSASTPTASTSTSKKNKKPNVRALSQTPAATSSGATTPVPVLASFGTPTPTSNPLPSITPPATQLSAASSSLNVSAAPFVPGTGVKIQTTNQAKRPNVAEQKETKAQKAERLAKEKEEKKRKEQEACRAKEEEEKRAREEEHKLREAEEKEREEAERKAQEKAEKARAKAERKRKAGEAQRKAEEEEQKAWEEELKAKDEERRLAEAEREAQEKAEKAEAKRERKRKTKEAKRIAQEAEEARLKLEAAKANQEGEEQGTPSTPASPNSANGPLPLAVPDSPPPLPKPTPTPGGPERPTPSSSGHSRLKGSLPVAPVPSLAHAPPTEGLNAAPHFEEIGKPNPEPGTTVALSPSRYSREFLLQFMNDNKDKPPSLAPLGPIGLDPHEPGKSSQSTPQSGDRRPSGFTTMGDVFKELRPKPAPTKPGGFSMGNSKTPWSRMSDSQTRPDSAASTRGGVPSTSLPGGRLAPTTQTGRPTGAPRAFRPSEPTPPPKTSTRWLGGSLRRVPATIQDLLNKLTADNFVSLSNRIVQLADRSEQIKNGSLLMRIAKLVFNSARNDPMYGEMYARLCRKMVKSLSPDIQDDTVCDWDEQPVTGGMLFRRYLLHLCQEGFERGWNVQWAESSAVSRVKRQGLGLVRFMGELFKLKLLTERTMHECIKKLLSNNIKPKEEDIESLCELLTTAGRMLDNRKARNHMDIFFKRMNEIANKRDLSWRIRFMLQDVIELRTRRWQAP